MSKNLFKNNKSTIYIKRIEELLKDIIGGYDPAEMQTEEQIQQKIFQALTEFSKYIDESYFTAPLSLQGDIPDYKIYDKSFEDILKDLTVLFAETENMENETLNLFNFVTQENNKYLSKIKRYANLVQDAELTSRNLASNIFYFTDTFNNLIKTDYNSTLIGTSQATMDNEQGIALLPIDTEANSLVTTTITPALNEVSLGRAGNNEETAANYNGDISIILDNNPDTWFEFEKVRSLSETGIDKVTLDFTVILEEPKIVNFVRINPNFFDKDIELVIVDIKTSYDGSVFSSIKDDLPNTPIIEESFNDNFILTSNSNNYEGQGFFSFVPRKAKFVNFVLENSRPYRINTAAGVKERYAIGIRDIELRAYQYQREGELITKNFTTLEEIRKVALDFNQYPTANNSLGSIEYFISFDNGQFWHPIGGNNQSFLPVNTYHQNSIKTQETPYNIKLKALLKRNDDGFQIDNTILSKNIEKITELYSITTETPLEIELNHFPVEDSISIIETLYGSCGKKKVRYNLGMGQSEYILPFEIKPVLKKVQSGSTWPNYMKYNLEYGSASETLKVLVNNDEWNHITQNFSSYTANYDTSEQYRVYQYDRGRNSIIFGNGYDTMEPPDEAMVSFYLTPQRLFFDETNKTENIAYLDYPASGDKRRCKIYRKNENVTFKSSLPVEQTVIDIKKEYFDSVIKVTDITDYSNLETLLTGLGKTKKDYLNGIDELTISTDWSIDIENGILYLKTPLSEATALANRFYTLRYTYKEYLKEDDYDFTDNDTIKINPSLLKVEVFTAGLYTGQKKFELPHFNLTKLNPGLQQRTSGTTGSFVSTARASNIFLTEIAFFDGETEFRNPGYITVEHKLENLTADVSDIISFQLPLNIATNDTIPVQFESPLEDRYFYVEDSSAPTVDGHFYVDRNSASPTYRYIYAKVPSNFAGEEIEGKTFKYFVAKKAALNPDYYQTNLYSVDYKHGTVYTKIASPGSTSTGVTNYQARFTYRHRDNFFIEYDIARPIDKENWTYNFETNTIEIGTNEGLEQYLTTKAESDKLYYQISYNYVKDTADSILELRQYFSPVLKDYALKVKTK